MVSLHTILNAYHLNEQEYTVHPISTGLINTTWLLKNCDENYILQKVNHHIFRSPDAIARNIRYIADFLSARYPGYLFVAPLKTKDDHEMVQEADQYYRLIPFVKKSHTISTVATPEEAFEAAKKFGEFTRLLSGIDIRRLHITLPDFHNLSLRYTQFTEALQNGNPSRIAEAQELIRFIQQYKDIVETYEHILKNPAFKLRVTHHDTKISNVLFDEKNKGLCVIDLDTVMPGYFISDVGDMMRTYLSPVNEEEKDFSRIDIREEYFKSIWEGYMSEMKTELNKEERRHFIYSGKFMIYMQAIRFLTDYLNNDTYYGSRYEGQNFIRAGNQVALLKKLIDKEDLLKSLIKHQDP